MNTSSQVLPKRWVVERTFAWLNGSRRLSKEVLRKNLCKFDNSDKKRYCERLEKQPLNFFTVYNTYRNLSSFSNSQSAEMERSGMEAD